MRIEPAYEDCRRTEMAKGYWITLYRSISDPAALAAYGKLAGPAIVAHGGRFLARGEAVKAHEQGIAQREHRHSAVLRRPACGRHRRPGGTRSAEHGAAALRGVSLGAGSRTPLSQR